MRTTPISRRARGAQLVAIVATAVTLGACNDFLKATNPAAIEADKLNDSLYINLMVNGVIGEFQPMLNDVTFWTAKFTDETRNHHVFSEEIDMDLRRVQPENGTYGAFMYGPMQRTRFLADSIASRLRVILPDSATLSLRISRVLVYSGYSHIILAEVTCGAPIDLSTTLTPDSLFGRARTKLTEARTIANAFRATIPAGAAAAAFAASDTLISTADVGIARAALGMGDWAAAEAAAARVTNTTFSWRAYYSDNSARQNNRIFINASSGSTANNAISVTPFFQVGDLRVPYPATNEGTQNGIQARVPNSPSSWSTFTGTAPGGEFSNISNVRVASYLEAQYIFYEARLRQGNTTGALAFINTRRAAGGQAPAVLATAATMLAEMRIQRGLDFYLDMHRLGDMRRYLRRDAVNYFESGLYPGTTTGVTYGDQVCFPLHAAEMQGNPNASQPPNAP
jgi:hypothetical protein